MAALLCAATAAFAHPHSPFPDLLIDHVTVVDVRTGRLVRDRAVLVSDGKIARIAKGGSIRAGRTARRVDARGRFLIPGLNDMHAHNLNSASPETSLPLMLANGITGFRQMAGSPQLLAARAAGTLPLPANAPELLAMPGTILTAPPFADPAAVAAEIARQKAAGADFIKVIDLPPATFSAAAKAARAQGLPFAGHLPPTVDERTAIAEGMASIEHLGPGISVLLSCSRDETAIRGIIAAAPAPQGGAFAGSREQVQRMLANPMLATPSQGFRLIKRVLASFDQAKCRDFARDLAASETWMVPTLVRLEAMELGDAPAMRFNPNLRYVPASSRQLWNSVGDAFGTRLTPDQREVLADLFAAQLRLAKLFDEAGVKMLAGTDFGGGWIVPGFSLHREFDLFAEAGVPPLRILQMSTLDPARFLGRKSSMGTVEVGRNANLVLLSADPTATAANLHKITGVVRGGRYYDRAALDAIEESAAKALQ